MFGRKKKGLNEKELKYTKCEGSYEFKIKGTPESFGATISLNLPKPVTWEEFDMEKFLDEVLEYFKKDPKKLLPRELWIKNFSIKNVEWIYVNKYWRLTKWKNLI